MERGEVKRRMVFLAQPPCYRCLWSPSLCASTLSTEFDSGFVLLLEVVVRVASTALERMAFMIDYGVCDVDA